ncbi:hypothetical protein Tco_1479682, partial [Tanacetum coccineum]
MSKRARSTRGQASSSHEETMEERSANLDCSITKTVKCIMTTSSGALFTPEMLLIRSSSQTRVLLRHSLTPSIRILSPDHNGSTFFKSTIPSSASLFVNSLPHSNLILLPAVGLYSEWESREVATLSKLRRALMVNSSHLNYLFWPSIGDGGYNVGNTKGRDCLQHSLLARQIPKERKGKGYDFQGDVCDEDSLVLWFAHRRN